MQDTDRMQGESQGYHLKELDIALSQDNPHRIMPAIPERSHLVLDVGCGAGQTLIASETKSGSIACGVDCDLEALRLGKKLDGNIHFVCALGEELPFKKDCFDFAICRVSLPYMDIPISLSEMGRVTKSGGRVWLVLHPFSMVLRRLFQKVKSLDVRDSLYTIYVLTNGLLLHLQGKQCRFPFNRKRCESFQTRRSITRQLRCAGFDNVEIERGRFFIVMAEKVG